MLPEAPEFVEREHGQSATNDGQTLQIVLFGVGFVFEVLGNDTKSLQDVFLELSHGDWALDEGGGQTGLSRSKKFYMSQYIFMEPIRK